MCSCFIRNVDLIRFCCDVCSQMPKYMFRSIFVVFAAFSFCCIDFVNVSIFLSSSPRTTSDIQLCAHTHTHQARKFSRFHKNVHTISDHAYRGTLHWNHNTPHNTTIRTIPFYWCSFRTTASPPPPPPPPSVDRKLPHTNTIDAVIE